MCMTQAPNNQRIWASHSRHDGPWGPRQQREYIAQMHKAMQTSSCLTRVLKEIRDKQQVSCPGKTTLEGWYKHYEDHHEFPYVTQRFYKDLEKRKSRRKGAPIKFTRKWSPYFIKLLQNILRDHPEFYLDEFVEELYVRSGVLFHPSSVSLVLRKRLGYSL